MSKLAEENLISENVMGNKLNAYIIIVMLLLMFKTIGTLGKTKDKTTARVENKCVRKIVTLK